MRNHEDYKREAENALLFADDAWQAQLVAEYGNKAGTMRYLDAGMGVKGSALRRAHDHRQLCFQYWELACIALTESREARYGLLPAHREAVQS